jgi:hypothetical protein
MKRAVVFFLSILLILTLAACTAAPAVSSAGSAQVQNTTGSAASAASPTPAAPATVAEALAENSQVHQEAADYTWDSASVTAIVLNGSTITAQGKGVSINGSTATLTAAGTYSLSGTLADGQIRVDTPEKGVVRLILNGVDLRSATSAPIYVVKAEKTVIILADHTQNTVTDAAAYVFESAGVDEPNAAIYSKADLTLYGGGTLVVNANYQDGIASKDGLLVTGGNITVTAADDGLRGKDYLVVEDGSITVNAQGDGLKSDNEEDPAKGYLSIEQGTFNITTGGDALTAQTDVMIAGGVFTLTSGGGSTRSAAGAVSAKGIKGAVAVNIDGGTFTIDSADDAVHSNGSITINGGTFHIQSADDGMHADAALSINGGEIEITRSYEGLESAVITINDGSINLVASDDGINVAGGVDGSGMQGPMGAPGGGRQRPGAGAPAQDTFNYTGSFYLYIHGGSITVNARGDGLDVNGAIEMTGGTVLVSGPTEQMNGALDYDAGFKMSGGFLAAAGSSGMAMAPGQASSQPAVLVYFTTVQPAGSPVSIQNSAGEEILSFTPANAYQSLAFSSPQLTTGSSYQVYTAGQASSSFTVSGVVTTVGSGGMRGGRP